MSVSGMLCVCIISFVRVHSVAVCLRRALMCTGQYSFQQPQNWNKFLHDLFPFFLGQLRPPYLCNGSK